MVQIVYANRPAVNAGKTHNVPQASNVKYRGPQVDCSGSIVLKAATAALGPSTGGRNSVIV